MKEITCDIIKDLLPSYVDHICSEDSRHLIEEHIDRCEQCRTRLKLMEGTELTDEQGEQNRITYLRKIKRHYQKGIISLVLLTLMLICVSLLMVYSHALIRSMYIIFPLSLIAAYGLMPDNPLTDRRSKASGVFAVSSIAVSILMMVYYAVPVFRWQIPAGKAEISPFGIPLHETGPYLEKRLVLMAAAQLGIFVLSNMMIFCGYRIHKSIYGLTLTGFWLTTGYICTLHQMTTVEGLYRLLAVTTVCLIVEGILFSVAAHIFVQKIHLHA